jgi:hypothetical protein
LDIAGSRWYFGETLLKFLDNGKVRIHGWEYEYTYDAETGTGHVKGDLSNTAYPAEGIAAGDSINDLGDFSAAENGRTLKFNNYRNSGISVVFSKEQDITSAEERLTGTAWYWPSLVLEFLHNGKGLLYSTTGYYPHPIIYPYSYANKTGSFGTAENAFSSSTSLGSFEIKQNFKAGDAAFDPVVDYDLYFSDYKSYGHRADFVKRENQ